MLNLVRGESVKHAKRQVKFWHKDLKNLPDIFLAIALGAAATEANHVNTDAYIIINSQLVELVGEIFVLTKGKSDPFDYFNL